MLTYQQIVDHILTESGQFFDTLESTQLDTHKVEMLIIRELKYYSKYKPKRVTFKTQIDGVKEFSVTKDGFIPDAITNIRYSEYNGSDLVGAMLFRGMRRAQGAPLSTYYWRYEKPMFYLRGQPGIYEVSGILNHYYDQLTKEIRTLYDSSYDFLNLVVAKFMLALGRSRRAFTISEIPFTSDAESLVSEGNQLLSEARDRIETTSNFHLAVIP